MLSDAETCKKKIMLFEIKKKEMILHECLIMYEGEKHLQLNSPGNVRIRARKVSVYIIMKDWAALLLRLAVNHMMGRICST